MAIKKVRQPVQAKRIEAAGIMFFAQETGKFLSIYRSAEVVDPNCWCSGGGKIEEGETPEEAARREIHEELGFDTYEVDGEYTSLYTYKSENLTFYNFLGVVSEQFFPKLNWESDGYVWTKLEHLPTPMHYGLQAILNDSDARDIIREKTAVKIPDRFVDASEDSLVAFEHFPTEAKLALASAAGDVQATALLKTFRSNVQEAGYHQRSVLKNQSALGQMFLNSLATK